MKIGLTFLIKLSNLLSLKQDYLFLEVVYFFFLFLLITPKIYKY